MIGKRWLLAAAVLALFLIAIVASGVLAPAPVRVLERPTDDGSPAPAVKQPVSNARSAPVAATEAPAAPAACPDFTLRMTLASGRMLRGCLDAAEVSQLGTTWRYRFDGDNAWRLAVTTVGRDIQSVDVSSPEGRYACRRQRCEGIRIAGPNQSGEKRIALAATPVYRPGADTGEDQQPAARLTAELSTPVAKPICGGEALRVLYDDGTGRSFCATTVSTDMAQPGRKVFTFGTLDGDSLEVRANNRGRIIAIGYDGGAYRCERTACAGVETKTGDGPLDVRGFRFGATTLLRASDDAGPPPTVSFYGELTVPHVDF